MPDTWIDVTTLLKWKRPVVGIVRAEMECVIHALERKGQGFRFCCFEALAGCFHEVTTEELVVVLRKQGRGLSSVCVGVESPVMPPMDGGQKSFTSLLKAWLVSRLPSNWQVRVFHVAAHRRTLYRVVSRCVREVYSALRDLWHLKKDDREGQVTEGVRPVAMSRHVVPFVSDDTYLSLGIDWLHKDLQYLFAQKRQVGFKIVLFCYDVIPLKFPHLCVEPVAAQFSAYLVDMAWCADLICCISQCTRKDLTDVLDALGAPVPQMPVIQLGSDIVSTIAVDQSSEVTEIRANKYILFVSTIERRKNHETLYRAYVRLIDSGITDLPLLVFVGMRGWGIADLLSDLRLDYRIRPYVRLLHQVSDSDLVRLYEGAYFTVYPSLYEGWGLPVAESLAFGKFCLASNVASIPEVGGDLIEYLDPWDVPAWTDRLYWYFQHPEELLRREQRIKNEYIPTTWKGCVEDIFRLISAQ